MTFNIYHLTFIVTVLSAVAYPLSSVQAQMASPAKYAYIEDYPTGVVLMEKNAEERMPPASMSKLMTIYMVFEALQKGHLTMDQQFIVSQNAFKKGGIATGGSTMFLEIGKRVSVEELLNGIIIQSGNDACIVIAEGMNGTEAEFAAEMNRKAKELGLTGSHFVNATGLPADGHMMTPKDLVMLAEIIYQKFPEYYPLFAKMDYKYNKITQKNRNPLLYWPTTDLDRELYKVDGLKTGHTQKAGYGLVASGEAVKEGRRIFMVFSGTEIKSEGARRAEGIKLMRWALGNFDKKMAVRAGDVLGEVDIWLGKEKTAPVTVVKDFQIIVPKTYREKITGEMTYHENLPAPIKKGTVIGNLTVKVPDMPEQSVDICMAENVKEAGFFKKLIKKAKYKYLE